MKEKVRDSRFESKRQINESTENKVTSGVAFSHALFTKNLGLFAMANKPQEYLILSSFHLAIFLANM